MDSDHFPKHHDIAVLFTPVWEVHTSEVFKHLRSVDFPNWSKKDRYVVVFGEVIGVHIEDQYITPEGLIDVDGMKPIGRLGYDDYTIVGGDSIFTMTRPE